MPLLADIDLGRVLVPALVALIVPLVLGWLFPVPSIAKQAKA